MGDTGLLNTIVSVAQQQCFHIFLFAFEITDTSRDDTTPTLQHPSLVNEESEERQRYNNYLREAILNDFIPVSISGREEDLKIALHSLAGKVYISFIIVGAISLSCGNRIMLCSTPF